MSLTLIDKLFLYLKHVPNKVVKDIAVSLLMIKDAGLSIPKKQVISHGMIGGNVQKTAAAWILAESNNINTKWLSLASINLTGHDPLKAIEECITLHKVVFCTYSDDSEEVISGFCGDGTKVVAEFTISYYLSPDHVFGSRLEQVRERLACKLSSYINQTKNWISLNSKKPEHEIQLASAGREIMSRLQDVRITYRRD
jgi:uncharacterized protein YqfA (UPF0365 family)